MSKIDLSKPQRPRRNRGAVVVATTTEIRERMGASFRAARAAESKALDIFDSHYDGGDDILRPPYPLHELAAIGEQSDSVQKCAMAMATNIGGHGYTFIPSDDVELPEAEDDPAWDAIGEERRRLARFFRYAWAEGSFTALRGRRRISLEYTGNGYWEVLRRNDQTIEGFEHLPAHTMRLRRRGRQMVEMPIWQRDPISGEWEQIRRRVRPRTFVQLTDKSADKVYFKQFGDPRHMDYRDGRFEGEDGKGTVPLQFRATEVVHFRLHVSDLSPYGIPRWIPVHDAAYARATAMEKNADTVQTNGLPSALMWVASSGDMEADIKRLEEQFVQASSGSSAPELMILPLDMSGIDQAMAGETTPTPKAGLVKLNDLQQQDALYMKYMDAADGTVASCFRLPPLFIGRSDDYTRATASSAKQVGQEQVFAPEATEEDYWLNERLLPDLGARYWRFQTLLAPSADEEVMAAVVTALSTSAGITPQMASELASKYLGLKATPEDLPYGALPSSLVDKWVTAGVLPPPESVMDALSLLEDSEGSPPPTDSPGDAGDPMGDDAPVADDDASDGEPGEEERARRRRKLRMQTARLFGVQRAQRGRAGAANVLRHLLRDLRAVRASIESGELEVDEGSLA